MVQCVSVSVVLQYAGMQGWMQDRGDGMTAAPGRLLLRAGAE